MEERLDPKQGGRRDGWMVRDLGLPASPWGDESQRAGFVTRDIDADGRLDIIFMAVNNPSGANDIRYRVRMGL